MDAKTSQTQGRTADEHSHLVRPAEMEWQKTRFPGCEAKTLLFDKKTGLMTALMRFEPGAVLPDHEHVKIEQTYVLEGKLVDREGPASGLEAGQGEFVWREPGSRHSAWCPEGGLMLAEDAAGLEWLRRKSAMERRWGIESHVLGANELRSLAPALSEHMAGADLVPAEGYGDPLRGTMAVLQQAQRAGARLLRGAEVQSIERNAAAWHVQTTKGLVIAGRVVNAAGPWAAQLGRMVGLELPVTGTVQQVIVTEPAPPMMKHLIALANRHLSLKQQASGGFLVGGGWFGGFDPASGRTHNLRRNIEGNLWVCARVLPVLRSLSFVRTWTGINPAIDRAPILGEAPGLPGFFNAVSANGYTLGPIIGRITADAVRGESVNAHYRLERFG